MKILTLLKISCCLLILFSLVTVKINGQNKYAFNAVKKLTTTTDHVKDLPEQKTSKQTIQEALRLLNKLRGVYFLLADKAAENIKVDAVSNMRGTTEQILNELLKDSNLKFEKINEKTFVISLNREQTQLLPLVISDQQEKIMYTSAKMFSIVSGRVTSADGTGLPGVSVTVRGSSRGTVTASDGSFRIDVNQNEVLVFSSVGYTTLERRVSSTSEEIIVALQSINKEMTEVVVTALGVRRERRSLGYSVTEVKGSELTEAREINVGNSLVGKVAGLNVNSVAGGPGASTNIVIRGISSLGQTNQPLYVINGIPMESTPKGQTGTQYDNGVDRGDEIGNLNPDDIESISVLKGAAASALYGYRAKGGVILITTKTARNSGIEFNSNYVAEKMMDPTDWQYTYGQGSNNIKPADRNAAFQAGQSSWGGKLDGSNVIQFDGVSRPYVAQRDNLENFYRTGGTFTNTIAFNKTFTGAALRFSASDLTNKAVIPNSGLNRQSFNLTTNFNPTKNMVIDARANYILEQAKNRPFLSDGPGNSNYNVMFLPTSVDVNVLKKTVNPDGTEYGYSANAYATNPWFAANNFINNTTRERLISSLNLRYNFNNGFFVQGRTGRDAYNDRYTGVVPSGTAYRVKGSITEQSVKFSDINVDGLAGKTFKLENDFTVTPNIGASYRRTKSEAFTNIGNDFSVPGVYNILNTQNKAVDYLPRNQETQSVYATLELNYHNFLYLTGSERNDWFSTLATPGKNNKLNVFYPSISGSFVFSQFLKNDWLSFGKLRAGYAKVGQATDPFLTQLSYTFNSATLNGRPLGSILNSTVPNSALQPSLASELEVGTELRFLKNRLSLDVTYYNKKSTNEILSAPASISSGYTGAVLNIGELQNKGVEALVSANIVKSGNFNWTSSVNGSINDNKVLALAAGQSQLAGGTSRSGVGFTATIVGLPAGQIMAYDYKYDASGKIVLNSNGIPDRGDLKPWGSAYHKWIAGWNNEFNFKKLNFSFLIDGKWGGKLFSATDYYGYIFGLHKATLVDREKNFGTTANPIDAPTYYGTLANNVSKLFVQDASFVKFRQILVGYSIPGKVFNNYISSVNISLVGRNLFLLMKKTDNIDPEANFSATPGGLTQGLELGGVPPVRSFGLNINVKF